MKKVTLILAVVLILLLRPYSLDTSPRSSRYLQAPRAATPTVFGDREHSLLTVHAGAPPVVRFVLTLIARPALVGSPPAVPRELVLPHPSPRSIFDAPPPSFAGLDRRKLITVIATGDVIPARSVNYEMTIRGDFSYPFERTYRFTRAADITLINLESPLISSCPVTNNGFVFCGDPRTVAGLQLAGVDVVNLPNNHIGNFGEAGITETIGHLEAAHIAWEGFGHVAYRRIRGITFAFLGFNGVGEHVDLAVMRREIRSARRHADVVVVSFHWGKEYTAVPETAPGIADQDPRMIAHAAVDDGADLIIGNHPHWVQGVEFYHGKFIAYAHGNFVFDQMWSEETKQGVVGTYTFYGKHLIAVRYRPVYIENWAQPHFLSAAAGAPILAKMRAATLRIAHGY